MCEYVCMITCIHVILFKIYYLCPLTVCSQNIYWNNAAQHSVWVTFFLHRKVFVWVCVFVCSVQLSNIRLPFYNFVLFGTIFYILLYFLIFLIVIILFIFQYVTIFIIFLKFFLFACSYLHCQFCTSMRHIDYICTHINNLWHSIQNFRLLVPQINFNFNSVSRHLAQRLEIVIAIALEIFYFV